MSETRLVLDWDGTVTEVSFEATGIELRLDFADAIAPLVRLRRRMHHHVVILGLHEIDVLDPHEVDAIPLPNGNVAVDRRDG